MTCESKRQKRDALLESNWVRFVREVPQQECVRRHLLAHTQCKTEDFKKKMRKKDGAKRSNRKIIVCTRGAFGDVSTSEDASTPNRGALLRASFL